MAAIGAQLVDEVANSIDDVEIVALAVAADVVGLARPAALEDCADCRTVIVDEEPVADVLAIPVNRQLLAFEGMQDHERNQLFRKLKRTVIIGAVGGEHRQLEGVEVGARQVIRAGLRRRVGAVGRVGSGLGECGIVGRERAIDFVSGNVQKAE